MIFLFLLSLSEQGGAGGRYIKSSFLFLFHFSLRFSFYIWWNLGGGPSVLHFFTSNAREGRGKEEREGREVFQGGIGDGASEALLKLGAHYLEIWRWGGGNK